MRATVPPMNPSPDHNPILVQAWRGGIVESAHRGAYAVVDADGALRMAAGDIERPVFPRSACKVLQALPLVASGAADALQLTDEELALACASHGGEAAHARTAASMLAKAGVDLTALECGAHWPYNEQATRTLAHDDQTPSALHNNCSGKHAGFVCLGCQLHGGRADLRGFLAGYVKPEHPVMREVSAALQAATGFDLSTSARGTDGCSIPTYAVPLRHLALAFARVATGQGLNADHARAAIYESLEHERASVGDRRATHDERVGPAHGELGASIDAAAIGAHVETDAHLGAGARCENTERRDHDERETEHARAHAINPCRRGARRCGRRWSRGSRAPAGWRCHPRRRGSP